MRNLYKILNLDKNASRSEIISKLQNIRNSDLRKDLEIVLLNETNKVEYDKVIMILENITRLRINLGIDYALNWQPSLTEEFQTSNMKKELRYEKFKLKLRKLYYHDTYKYKTGEYYKSNRNNSNDSANFSNSTKRKTNSSLKVFIGIVIIFIIFAVAYNVGKKKSIPQNNTSLKYNNEISQPYLIPISPPLHGYIKTNIHTECIAPLEIKTDSRDYYLVKLVSIYSKSKYFMIFIYGGRTVNIDVPLGSYTMKYSSGNEWYGFEEYFGPNGGYNKSDDLLNFEIIGNQITGYTVTLYKVPHGNFQTYSIDRNDF